MGLLEILGLLEVLAKLIPMAAAAIPAARRLIEGTGTEADIDTLKAVTAALNVQADQAERDAGATV
jgi:hypothetical protein